MKTQQLILGNYLSQIKNELGLEKAIAVHQAMLATDTFQGGIDYLKKNLVGISQHFQEKTLPFKQLNIDEQHLVIFLIDLKFNINDENTTAEKIEIMSLSNPTVFFDFINCQAHIEPEFLNEYIFNLFLNLS